MLDAARSLGDHLAALSQRLQDARAEADKGIHSEIGRLNRALADVADLNAQIVRSAALGQDISGLADQRQQLVDGIASLIPLRETPRNGGAIALHTTTGLQLVDGRASAFAFDPAGVVVAGMTRDSGALSGLALDGDALRLDPSGGQIAGGSLAARFTIRDELAPAIQAQLDALAQELVSRFAAPGLDPTVPPGGSGLFIDTGAMPGVAATVGLAGRLGVNPVVEPAAGGALWRLRDGVGATTPGDEANATILLALASTLTARAMPASDVLGAGAQDVHGLAGAVLSDVARRRLDGEGGASFASARETALRKMELEAGVDTDHEMQALLQIEQAYAANARVIRAVDEMIKTLLGI